MNINIIMNIIMNIITEYYSSFLKIHVLNLVRTVVAKFSTAVQLYHHEYHHHLLNSTKFSTTADCQNSNRPPTFGIILYVPKP